MAEQTQTRTKLRRFVRVCVWSLIVLVIAVVVVNNTVARLPSMPSAEGKYISVRGKVIHYVEHPGQGIPVVMIHGLPGTYRDFDPVLPALKGMHVIEGRLAAVPRPDRRGPRPIGTAEARPRDSRRALFWRHARARCGTPLPVDENVPQIRVPSVIIGGENDHLIGIDHVRRLAETLPSTKLISVDESHMIPYTHPDVIAEQVKSASRG